MPVGPRDSNPAVTDLLAGFDPARLSGEMPPIQAAEAEIPDSVVNAMPTSYNCLALGMKPVALPNAPSTPPPNFTPRPHRSNGAD
jgi:hypothetical protein